MKMPPDARQMKRALREADPVANVTAMPALRSLEREFRAMGEDRYQLVIPELATVLELDRLRRERHELIGELSVKCGMPGARTVDGDSLSIADFNLSSARARQDRAKLLAARSDLGDFDWDGLVEELCQRVLKAERTGQPATDLRLVPRSMAGDDLIEIEGFALPKRHPSILFGDGGTAKSYMALYVAGKLAQSGIPVAYFDWELAAEEHRDRLERLFPDHMPKILYARCERPLVHESDRLRRIARDAGIEFVIYDSVAFACDGAPEDAETAGRYFRAVRQIGGGSLHVAHMTKGEHGDKKPFGSVFWYNGARSIWFAQVADSSREDDVLEIGLFHRKANLGRVRPPAGFSITFSEDRTVFGRTQVADSPDLASQLSIRQKMVHILRNGAVDSLKIASELDADLETVKRTARRYKNLFVVIEGGGRIGLLERKSS
jgi:hypothetical protein